MTAQNFYELARSETISKGGPLFEGYCMPAAIDACFTEHDVPPWVYEASYLALKADGAGGTGSATDEMLRLMGQLIFGVDDPRFRPTVYTFSSEKDLYEDLAEIRKIGTILLDVNDEIHSVGLKPHGNNPDEWQIVGTHQVIAVSYNGKLDVQCIVEPEILTTGDVWKYLVGNNPPETESYTALVFPPEPS